MPKVLASSGTIGTMFLPMVLSFVKMVNSLTNDIVVEIARSPVPASISSNIDRSGTSIGTGVLILSGRKPPRFFLLSTK